MQKFSRANFVLDPDWLQIDGFLTFFYSVIIFSYFGLLWISIACSGSFMHSMYKENPEFNNKHITGKFRILLTHTVVQFCALMPQSYYIVHNST